MGSVVTLMSTPWIAVALAARWEALEANCTPRACPQSDAIVVLGGDPTPIAGATAERSRLLRGIEHFEVQYARRLILSGGPAGATTEARLMAGSALSRRVEPHQMVLEERSRNTFENALFTAAIARQLDIRHVILVTHALHMPRAAASFRRRGLSVTASSVCMHRRLPLSHATSWIPRLSSLSLTLRLVHEVAGMAAYRWQGRL